MSGREHPLVVVDSQFPAQLARVAKVVGKDLVREVCLAEAHGVGRDLADHSLIVAITAPESSPPLRKLPERDVGDHLPADGGPAVSRSSSAHCLAWPSPSQSWVPVLAELSPPCP